MTAVTTACGASPSNIGQADLSPPAAKTAGNNVTSSNAPINQRFKTLDDYLAWLEMTQAPIDKPWYREIRPGVYELQTGNLRILPTDGSEEKRIFTREELERMFGFKR